MLDMHEITFKIDDVNEPDKFPEYGSIRGGGKYWSVPKSMMPEFRGKEGTNVTIGYTTNEKNGKTYYNIKEVRTSSAPSIGHNNAPATNAPSNGNDKDMISALALYNHTSALFFARFDDKAPDRQSMGDFLMECMLAVDWAKMKHKKFWAEKSAPKPPPQEPPFNDDLTF